MKVEFSREFEKSVKRLTGKMLSSVRDMIQEVIDAKTINDISNCKKLVDFDSVYRIRIGDYRAFFVLHIQTMGNVVMFQYLVSRGEAYDRKIKKNLRAKDSGRIK
jgi:mRNA-degrading endonuclease RelE of RelBE toxin-antitoxin system